MKGFFFFFGEEGHGACLEPQIALGGSHMRFLESRKLALQSTKPREKKRKKKIKIESFWAIWYSAVVVDQCCYCTIAPTLPVVKISVRQRRWR
jgi:hypothetical protein